MGRNLSLLARLPRLEADGVTHRRDCECVRCDAGFAPSEGERAAARRSFDQRRSRERAERALERSRELHRLKRDAVSQFVEGQVQATDAHLRAMRAARERVDADTRLQALWNLRRSGLSLREALDRVEAGNDNDQNGDSDACGRHGNDAGSDRRG